MSTYQDLIDTMRLVQERTGDPLAWMTGLTPEERVSAVAPTTTGPQIDALVAKIRRLHPDLLNPPPQVPADRADGDAAKAIAEAEAALAQQNSLTSQLDLQVVSAILNAHLTTAEGRDALTNLQHEIETAVATRSDLDTPAGARDFQRYLIGKLRDIHEVVATAGLDDTSKSTLMAAWTSLYNASKSGSDVSTDPRPAAPSAATRGGNDGGSGGAGEAQPPLSNAGSDPLLDALLSDDPGLTPGGGPAPQSASAPTAPNPAGEALPAGGGMPPFSAPSGLPLPSLSGAGTGRDGRSWDDGFLDDEPIDRGGDKDKQGNEDDEEEDGEEDGAAEQAPSGQPESLPMGPTTVTLPNGETVTAASPQLAAAIKAAASGTPIADAFQQQGMTIPPPGTAVGMPIDASRVAPGDIGMFTDRHALALGRSRALLDGQIQHISNVTGPSFLGWEHPPAPAPQTSETAPAQTDTPTPTRPSAATT